ncbi:MAG: thiamine phosphate synthase [Candidatus Methanospirareceae archaeon]
MRGYYFITDDGLSISGTRSDVKNAVAANVVAVQYRDKKKTTEELVQEAIELKKLCGPALFIMNDRVDVAMAAGADGVHLGQDDLPYESARKLMGNGKIIGVTVHSLDEARRAQEAGANYIAVSPIFSTTTKLDAGTAAGLQLLRDVKRHCTVPVVAIGGINMGNLYDVIEAGADCVCAISAVITKGSVRKEIEKFQEAFR